MNFEVICINDNGFVNEIPFSKRPIKGNKYTVIRLDYINQQNRILGVQLAEIDLSDCFPYTYFRADRFAPCTTIDEEELEISKQELELKY